MDFSAWLQDLGLERYAAAFAANDVDPDVLAKLTAEDLIAIGVTSVGHRRKLLEAIDRLRAQADEAGPASAPEPPAHVAPDTGPAAAAPARDAERRQLTVLFCDLVGSTALSGELDPEDMSALIRTYQNAVAGEILRFEGHVAKFMGDGVLAYFGWPMAHEDDAERAVRAGLATVDALARQQPAAGEPLAARVGIATGLVMVGELIGEGAAREEAVVGETPNLAARLQALAAPGKVVISQATRRLVGGLFELTDLGPTRLKGFALPLAAFRVEGEGHALGRFEALHGERVTPLIGREHELAMLMERWARAKDGDGQVILIAGEAGIGKSRLLRALREQLAGEPHVALRHFCSPYHTNSALHPIVAQLERAAGFAAADQDAARLGKLEVLLGRATERLDEAVPLVAALLGVPSDGRFPALNLSPQRQKQRTLEVLVEQLAGLARERPVLDFYEDLHWADPSTLELLDLLVERVRTLPVLVVITHRPEVSPLWSGQAHVTALTMNRLGRRQVAALVKRVSAGKALPGEVLDQILARTDGVPLFVEELTKAVLESGLLTEAGDRYELSGPLPPLAIPTTLHDSLMARLDRLAPVKEVAQTGAVVGREFAHELVAAVSPLPENKLREALDQLVASELVFRRGTPPDATYNFKHALVQDAAYLSLLKSRRQQLHAKIAEVLERQFPHTALEVLAHHLTEAQQYAQAVPKWLAAGQAATTRSAYAEAAANLRRGLEVVGQIADPTRQIGEEIRLQNALGFALIARGPVPDVADAYERARALCSHVDLPRELFTARFGLWFFSHMRLDLEGTARFSDELLAMVEEEDDSALALEAHHAAWTTGWPRGELEKSLAHAAAGIDLYSRERHHTLANVYAGHDPGVCARCSHGLVCWLLGFPDRAAERVEEALALARDLQHPFTLALTLALGSIVRQFRQEPEQVRELGRQTFAHCTEQGFGFHGPQGLILEGWALAALGQIHKGVEQMRQGLASLRAVGADARRSYFLGLLAEVCLRVGQRDAGLDALSEALDLVESNGEHWWQAELHRLQGELLLTGAGNGEARACSCFERALDVSRQQKARSLELRAATSLARLWAKQGKHDQARDLLAPVYDWFTEGFETADLKTAKALLDELR
jgi:class 3 adenylate cyclase/predicted ATPase